MITKIVVKGCLKVRLISDGSSMGKVLRTDKVVIVMENGGLKIENMDYKEDSSDSEDSSDNESLFPLAPPPRSPDRDYVMEEGENIKMTNGRGSNAFWTGQV